jgi:hypothetical protein
MGCGSILCDDPQPSCQEKVRDSGNRATVEDVVALRENGFGYDVAMVVASLADLTEPLDPALQGALALLQRQVKNGLTEKAALAFLEAAFADRVVATALGQAWPGVRERDGVQSAGTNARPFRLFSAGCRLILPRSPPSSRLDSGSHLNRTVRASRAQDKCAS